MQLTEKEFNTQRDKLFKKFASYQAAEMNNKVWKVGRSQHATARLLWLFVFAVNTWEHQDDTVNHLNETQLQLIFAKVNAL